ncbi:MAG: L-threonylcarbamoyladenylate synthase [Chitinophagales bacterium]
MRVAVKDIDEAVAVLRNGQTILYPTDTIWGIGCDATNEVAVDSIFAIKHRPKEKSLIVLVDSLEMLKQYVRIDDDTASLLASFELPTTVIYPHPVNIAANAVNADDTIAIRIVQHPFCAAMIKAFGKPIISTSANISGQQTPAGLESVSDEIKKAVDFVVDKKYDTSVYKYPSKLIRIKDDSSIEYLR